MVLTRRITRLRQLYGYRLTATPVLAAAGGQEEVAMRCWAAVCATAAACLLGTGACGGTATPGQASPSAGGGTSPAPASPSPSGPATSASPSSGTPGQSASGAASSVGVPTARPTPQPVGASVRVGAMTQVFATPLPANPARARVIEDFRRADVLWDKSESGHRLVAGLRSYVTGVALTRLTQAISFSAVHGVVPAGTDRFFKTRVTGLTSAGATVTTCDDSSKLGEKSVRTGRYVPQLGPQPGQAYLYESWHLAMIAGHWAIDTFTVATLPSASARQCQP